MNYSEINKLIGSDWSYPDNDCWQVFRKAALNVFGIDVEEVPVPKKPSIKNNARLFEKYRKEKQWHKIEIPEPGCAVLFRNSRRIAAHIGIYIKDGNVLHFQGSIGSPGKTVVQGTNYLKLMYKSIEYYKYAPDNDS